MKKWLLGLIAALLSFNLAFAAVDANSATAAELDGVPGIGPAIAARIVSERKNGPYKDLADLQQRVKGIGEANLKKMADGGLKVGGGSRTALSAEEKAARAEARKEKAAAKAAAKASSGTDAKAAAPAAAATSGGQAAAAAAGTAKADAKASGK